MVHTTIFVRANTKCFVGFTFWCLNMKKIFSLFSKCLHFCMFTKTTFCVFLCISGSVPLLLKSDILLSYCKVLQTFSSGYNLIIFFAKMFKLDIKRTLTTHNMTYHSNLAFLSSCFIWTKHWNSPLFGAEYFSDGPHYNAAEINLGDFCCLQEKPKLKCKLKFCLNVSMTNYSLRC